MYNKHEFEGYERKMICLFSGLFKFVFENLNNFES